MMLIALSSSAFACGGFFGKDGEVVVSDAQQAIVRSTVDSVSIEYRVRYQGTAQEFGWVVPVLGGVQTVEEGDESTFEVLQEQSAPTVYDGRTQSADEDVGCGCGAFAGSSYGISKGGDFGGEGGVVVTGQGFTGQYEYFILAAEDGDSLRQWLDDEGFDISTAGDVVDAYAADERGYEFVAVRVAQDAASPDMGTMFKPLRITWGPALDGELHAQYPARMNSTSTAETNNIQLYVFGEGLAEVGGGWTAKELGTDIPVPDGDDAEAYYNELLQDLGDEGRTLGLVWAGEAWDGGWFTRFDVILDPASQTSDIDFTDSGDMSTTYSTGLVYSDDPVTTDIASRAMFLVGIGALGAGLRRSRG